jgi:hypothetical protein
MSSSDAGDTDSDGKDPRAVGKKLARRDRKLASPTDEKPLRMAAAGRRIQQATHGKLVAAPKEAAERAADAARKAKEAALPRWAQLRHGARQWVAVNPEVAEKVTQALVIAVVGAAAKHSGKIHPAAKMVSPAIAAVGPMVATRTAGKVRKGFEKISVQADSATGEDTGESPAAEADTGSESSASSATTVGELADYLGVRQPPDPEALYRPGSGSLELMFPLPGDLASLPWSSLSARNRFFVLVAAWALRETDGIQALRTGEFVQADEIFQECLIRAEHMQVPELITRSYEDLDELAVASGDETAAREWRAAAERAKQGQQGKGK